MANHFGEADINSMEQPVIIVISSCRVLKYTDCQLSASSATYYYLNPKMPEAQESRALFKARYEETPPLTIYKHPHKDVQQDKTRNMFPLKTIMDQNPQSYKIRTTSFATNAAKQQLFTEKITIAWITAHNQDPSSKLVEKYKPADTMKIPPEILATQGKHAIFQFHFNILGNLTDLSLDAVYDVHK
nr:nucleic acid-binding, OB-fold protein [Tanacetum cinerariifolium]